MEFWKDARVRRGLAIVGKGMVQRTSSNTWTVASQTRGGSRYTVTLSVLGIPSCTCPDFAELAKTCKHIHAAMFFLAVESAAGGSRATLFPLPPPKAEATASDPSVAKPNAPVGQKGKTPDRPTFKQQWAAYNEAQKNEKDVFVMLLDPLCEGIPQPAQEAGRPRLPLRDVVYSAAMKVYLGTSGRRATTDLRDLAQRGHMEDAPSYNSISRYLDRAELTPVLRKLIGESAAPLKSFEIAFGIDATGFSSSTYRSWFDHKFGRMKFETDWVKANVLVGVTTHVVVQGSAMRGEADGSADGNHLVPLASEALVQGWKMQEISADMAYLSADNVHAIAALGAQPFIPFKEGVNYGGRKGNSGDVWLRMLSYFQDRREEFLTHYHKRSNVEAAIRMIKAKFGPYVRSKTETAQINEVLLKIVCHNICCLIQAIFEFNLAPVFWTNNTPPPGGKETS